MRMILAMQPLATIDGSKALSLYYSRGAYAQESNAEEGFKLPLARTLDV